MPGELFAIGKIVGCFGIKGYCKLDLLTDFPERLLKLKNVVVGFDVGKTVSRSFEDVRLSANTARIKFEEIDDRTSAEQLVGQFVFIPRGFLKKLKKDRYFVHDLVQCEVITVDGIHVGRIVDVYKFSAQDIWVVRDDAKEHLIPAVREFIESVDIGKKLVVIRPIEGLLDG
jgi:16S rRNA processing protein RimM